MSGKPSPEVNVKAIDSLLCGTDDRAFERDAGLAQGQMCHLRERGRCSVTVLDKIACALGTHYLLLLN